MAIISPGDTPIGDQIRNKIGRSAEYGCHVYGGFFYGEVDDNYGIYEIRSGVNGQTLSKYRFYFPFNPRSEAQQAHRQKITDASIAWRNLTDEQKKVYNDRVKGKRLSGQNLFLKEHLLSH